MENGDTEYHHLAWKNLEALAATTGLDLFLRYAQVEEKRYRNGLQQDRLAEEYYRIVEREIGIIASSQGT